MRTQYSSGQSEQNGWMGTFRPQSTKIRTVSSSFQKETVDVSRSSTELEVSIQSDKSQRIHRSWNNTEPDLSIDLFRTPEKLATVKFNVFTDHTVHFTIPKGERAAGLWVLQ